MPNYLWCHGLQYARLPCPSPSPKACSSSCPLSQWCHPTILSSVIPFYSCPQSYPASGSFLVSQLFAIRWPKYSSFSFSISPSTDYSGLIFFRSDWLDLLEVQGTLSSLHQHQSSKVSIFQCSAFLMVHLSHPYMTTGKTIALIRLTFGSSEGKASACNVGDPGSIPGSGRSLGEGNGNPLQYSCLENPTDRGAS